MKYFLLCLCFGLSISCFSQTLNNYKYVLVPEKFEEFKEPNKYNLNGLTQYLLSKDGFEAYLGKSNLPDDALNNNCLVLTLELVNDSGMFKTKLAIQFKDCKGQIIYTTPYGLAKDKKFKVAYNKALREAAKNFKGLNYSYVKPEVTEEVTIKQSETKDLQFEIERLKKEKNKLEEDLVEEKKAKLNKEEVKEEEAKKSPTEFYAKVRQKESWVDYNVYDEKGILYFVFYSTGKKDTFLVKQANNDKKLVCFKENGYWHLVSRDETNMEVMVIKVNF